MVKSPNSLVNEGKGAYRQSLEVLLPYRMLATEKWLAEQGLNAHALDNAVKTETLLPLARRLKASRRSRMDRSSIYYKQVQLLMQVLPFVAWPSCFALEGGTAINLFVREYPRLSVDIDLVCLPVKGRNDAFQEICETLDVIGADL